MFEGAQVIMFEEAHFRILPNSNESNPKMFAKKKSIITTFACFVSTASISTSQMCPLKSYVPPGMPAVPGRLMDREYDSLNIVWYPLGPIQNFTFRTSSQAAIMTKYSFFFAKSRPSPDHFSALLVVMFI